MKEVRFDGYYFVRLDKTRGVEFFYQERVVDNQLIWTAHSTPLSHPDGYWQKAGEPRLLWVTDDIREAKQLWSKLIANEPRAVHSSELGRER